eukprot:CAMPEP_0181126684 /NCGR_PEP_ID=MMETSP1071-20121207/27772_1 /TAXON_ID=35127 /ORGANISM="Thalassiosira sp., Strain NH16" /LENGTH=250 /DNA_ID=CAMNT_0023212325 /DNA_START=259 /DNA_END=1012 /DNA_ORIENTATION=-
MKRRARAGNDTVRPVDRVVVDRRDSCWGQGRYDTQKSPNHPEAVAGSSPPSGAKCASSRAYLYSCHKPQKISEGTARGARLLVSGPVRQTGIVAKSSAWDVCDDDDRDVAAADAVLRAAAAAGKKTTSWSNVLSEDTVRLFRHRRGRKERVVEVEIESTCRKFGMKSHLSQPWGDERRKLQEQHHGRGEPRPQQPRGDGMRHRAGELLWDIPFIVSNHENLRPAAEKSGIPYRVFPITEETTTTPHRERE